MTAAALEEPAMIDSIEQIERELLSFRTGEPVIVEPGTASEAGKEYNLTVFVRSLSDSTPHFVQSIQLRMIFSPAFPARPPAVLLRNTRLFHPNFTADGEWTDSEVREGESISDYLLRLVQTLQFKQIRQDRIGNRNAMAWYNNNKASGLFPTDKVNYNPKPRIKIIRRNGSLSS